jgi:hypothetical protein
MDADHFETLDSAVRRHVIDALTLARGNQRQAAALLGVTRWKVGRLITRFRLGEPVARIRSVARQVTATSVTEDSVPQASTSFQQGR